MGSHSAKSEGQPAAGAEGIYARVAAASFTLVERKTGGRRQADNRGAGRPSLGIAPQEVPGAKIEVAALAGVNPSLFPIFSFLNF
jgi:hypothetical protein